MPLYLGVDIASVDGNKPVDWIAAKNAGCRFAIFRGTYIQWADPVWKLEADRARAVGVVVGVYLFPVMDLTAPSAEAQVAAFVTAVGKLGVGDLPPWLDVEYAHGIAHTGRTRTQLLQWIRDAVAALKKAFGVSPGIYTSARVWGGDDSDSLDEDALGVPTPELLDCPLWLARYPFATRIQAVINGAETLALPPVPKAWGDALNIWIHQYQGDAIGFPGFSSTEDLNMFFDLRLGAKGQRVKWLQKRLGLVQDGDFGPNTNAAVMDYQRLHGLTVDGVVGPKTFAYLCWIKLA